MINRYEGNTGRVSRYPEQRDEKPGVPRSPSRPPPANGTKPRPDPMGNLERLTKMLPEKIGELETEDYILLLILYLMYRESGDSELLIIMGAMFLL